MGLILDSTCSTLRAWPEQADVRIDISRKAHPDIVATACALPFADHVFDEIYCDPPHRVRPFGRDRKYDRFTTWNRYANWRRFLVAVDREFSRCLKPTGLLHFKISDGAIAASHMIRKTDLAGLTNFVEVSDYMVPSKGFYARSNQKLGRRPSIVHFVTLQPRAP